MPSSPLEIFWMRQRVVCTVLSLYRNKGWQSRDFWFQNGLGLSQSLPEPSWIKLPWRFQLNFLNSNHYIGSPLHIFLDDFSSLTVLMREFHRFYDVFLSSIIFFPQLFWSPGKCGDEIQCLRHSSDWMKKWYSYVRWFDMFCRLHDWSKLVAIRSCQRENSYLWLLLLCKLSSLYSGVHC